MHGLASLQVDHFSSVECQQQLQSSFPLPHFTLPWSYPTYLCFYMLLLALVSLVARGIEPDSGNLLPWNLHMTLGIIFTDKEQRYAPRLAESDPVWATKVYQWLPNPQTSKTFFRSHLCYLMMSLCFYLKSCPCLASVRIIPAVSDHHFSVLFPLPTPSGLVFSRSLSLILLTCDVMLSFKDLIPSHQTSA